MVFFKLVHTESQVNHKSQPFWVLYAEAAQPKKMYLLKVCGNTRQVNENFYSFCNGASEKCLCCPPEVDIGQFGAMLANPTRLFLG